ncbi:MAG: hypothetical protein HQK77_08020 [Desulfobacterales bacterium]|nr:hypothetical protein [Desulfobacterales bacterium]
MMEKGYRYNMNHLGDIFVEKLANCGKAICNSTRGIVLTYNIHELNKKKQKNFAQIGERLTQVRNEQPSLDVFFDEKMATLYKDLDEIEERLGQQLRERQTRLYPRCAMTLEPTG